MGDTTIEWTQRPGTRGRVWNPTQGCSLVSEGCRNCYAMRLARRFAANGWSKGLVNLKTGKWTGETRVAEHKLADPMRWREPSTVFVNSMSDLFHEGFSNEDIAAVFGVMSASPRHTFIILTKRARRMKDWFEWVDNRPAALGTGTHFMHPIGICANEATRHGTEVSLAELYAMSGGALAPWPLRNVWIGVSVENQEAADERIPHLLMTPAAVRLLSCEPLLSPVDLRQWLCRESGLELIGAPRGLHWVIAGAESGAWRRDIDAGAFRLLRDQCKQSGTPFFLKQAFPWDEGRYVPVASGIGHGDHSDRNTFTGLISRPYLDGVQHLEFPA